MYICMEQYSMYQWIERHVYCIHTTKTVHTIHTGTFCAGHLSWATVIGMLDDIAQILSCGLWDACLPQKVTHVTPQHAFKAPSVDFGLQCLPIANDLRLSKLPNVRFTLQSGASVHDCTAKWPNLRITVENDLRWSEMDFHCISVN